MTFPENPSLDLYFHGDGSTPPPAPKPVSEPYVSGNNWRMPNPVKLGNQFHEPKGVPEHVGDSKRAIDFAIANHYDSIDLNWLNSKQGTPQNEHWPRPLLRGGFTDPLGKLHRDTLIRDMTDAEIARLVAPGGYIISTMYEQFTRCAGKIIVQCEAKFVPTKAEMQRLWDETHAAHCTTIVKALPEYAAALIPAREVGFQTRTIHV